jgi:MOSC domain-containing protein YiiM
MTLLARSVNVPRTDGGGPLRLVPAAGEVEIGRLGLGGGPDLPPAGDPAIAAADHALACALFAYPTLHHPVWQTIRAQAGVAAPDAPLPPASFDEHLALDGVQESQLWIGDLLRFPHCTLAVSAPRLPDERFAATLGFPQAPAMVAQSRWGGFWLAVRVPGRIAAGDPFALVPGPREVELQALFRARVARARRS